MKRHQSFKCNFNCVPKLLRLVINSSPGASRLVTNFMTIHHSSW